MKWLACLVAALILTATLEAQTPAPHFPVAGTVVKVSPVFLLREDGGRTPVVILPAGTTVQVTGRQGPWYRIVFTSASGDQAGLMEPSDVRIDPDAAAGPTSNASGTVSERGFVEGRGLGFPQAAVNDSRRLVGDALVREEVFLKPTPSFRLAMGVDLRGSSHDEVEDEWRVDFDDRGALRPRIAVRRLTASITTSHVSLDLGKQFIRWGRADILSPADRFAPRDYMNVIDSEFLPVLGARSAIHVGGETVEAVWLPRMTPSRLPLLRERWTVVPAEAAGLTLVDNGAVFPGRSEQGVRWSHAGRFEMGLSFFNGFNHLPDIDAAVAPVGGTVSLTRTYSALRTYGGEAAVPTRAFTLKGEAAYFTSPTATSEEYVLYVVEAERQTGEWLLDVGYAGEVVTRSRDRVPFAAERGVARSIIGRASYTIDPRRSLEVEGAVRQNGHGLYVKGEFSQTFGRHWRLTVAAAGIGGKADDFLGQYQRNSHGSATLRLSF
ncbi:MAG: hypothetical protein ABI051_00710 [Vicinamibacterales bacterium]